MQISNWFFKLFNRNKVIALDGVYADLESEIFYKELAIKASINLIANVITLGEFLTFSKGIEVKDQNYYLLNIEPNQNQSACEFWKKVINKMYLENECLVIQRNESFYVAESFDRIEFALKENIYKNIQIENFQLKGASFLESDVFYFKLNNENIKNVIDGLYNSYAKLIEASSKSYIKNKSKKVVLDVPTNYTQTQRGQEELSEILNKRFKTFFNSSSDAVLPLTNGIKYTEIQKDGKEKGSEEGKATRNFIDDIFDFTAMSFQIPPAILKGNIADVEKILNNFLTFCINPVANLITKEVNRKLYKKAFLEKNYTKLDTSRIKVNDLKDIANSLDVLTRIGAYTVDDSLKALGKEPLDTECSRARWITKNYERIEKMYQQGSD